MGGTEKKINTARTEVGAILFPLLPCPLAPRGFRIHLGSRALLGNIILFAALLGALFRHALHPISLPLSSMLLAVPLFFWLTLSLSRLLFFVAACGLRKARCAAGADHTPLSF